MTLDFVSLKICRENLHEIMQFHGKQHFLKQISLRILEFVKHSRRADGATLKMKHIFRSLVNFHCLDTSPQSSSLLKSLQLRFFWPEKLLGRTVGTCRSDFCVWSLRTSLQKFASPGGRKWIWRGTGWLGGSLSMIWNSPGTSPGCPSKPSICVFA